MDLILFSSFLFRACIFFCIQRRGRATTELAERPGERGRAIAPDAPVRLPFSLSLSLSLSLSQSHSPVKTQHSFLVSAAFVGAAAAAATAVVVVVAVVAVVVVVG